MLNDLFLMKIVDKQKLKWICIDDEDLLMTNVIIRKNIVGTGYGDKRQKRQNLSKKVKFKTNMIDYYRRKFLGLPNYVNYLKH